MSKGKTIRMYLADGSPTGLRSCELGNWSGHVLICPRARVGELVDWSQAQRPGAYILVDPATGGKAGAYIGEAENVFGRLQTHVKATPAWERAVIFSSKDGNLTKAHVKYLESRFVKIAALADRFMLKNTVAPKLPSLPRPDRDDMEDFIDTAALLLSALGFPIFQPLPGAESPAPVGPGDVVPGAAAATDAGPLSGVDLFLKEPKNGVDARGRYTDEGMVVFAGSVGVAGMVDYLSAGLKQAKEQLIQDGSVAVEGDKIRFVKTVVITSPSAAAGILSGGGRNGRVAWRDADRKSLKELEEGLAGA